MPSRRLVVIAALALSLAAPALSLAQSGRTAAALVKADPQLATLARALEVAGLEAALAFLDLPAPGADGIAATVEECRFERMQALEMAGAVRSRRLTVADPANPESRKVRRGKAGGYRDYLAAGDIAWIDGYLDRHLDPWYDRYRPA